MRHASALASSTAAQPLDYLDFVKAKIITLPPLGLPVAANDISPILKPHQDVLVRWAVEGGRRAIFAAFGLGKSLIQLEIMRQIGRQLGGRQLIVVPLTVLIEFKRDATMLGMSPIFIRSTAELAATADPASGGQLYLTNYESVREGKIDLAMFNAASLDTACRHGGRTIGIYGEGCRDSRRKYDKTIPEFTVVDGREAMECPWMTIAELCEAIPPAYTEFIGRQLLQHLQHKALAA